jgi:hypothetical protein
MQGGKIQGGFEGGRVEGEKEVKKEYSIKNK